MHTIVHIKGPYGQAEFIYENEENIEIKPESQPLNADELIMEVRNSVHRRFKDAYDYCVENFLAFPFARVAPDVDLQDIHRQIQSELER